MALQMRHALDLGAGFPRVAFMIKTKKNTTAFNRWPILYKILSFCHFELNHLLAYYEYQFSRVSITLYFLYMSS